MTWIQQPNTWLFNNNDGSLYRNINEEGIKYIKYTETEKSFLSNRTYLFRTKLKNLDGLDFSTTFLGSISGTLLEVRTEWSNLLKAGNLTNYNLDEGYLYFYSNPTSNINTENYIYYGANEEFDIDFGIYDFELFELNWNLHGYSHISDIDIEDYSSDKRAEGFAYLSDNDYIFISATNSSNKGIRKRVDGEHVRYNNTGNFPFYISTYVNYPNFNLIFEYDKLSPNTTDGLSIYLSNEPPPNIISKSPIWVNWKNNATFVADITQLGSIDANFFGLRGNSYVVITADNITTSNETIIKLNNLRIEGAYHPGNNKQYETIGDFEAIGLTGATFSALVGNGNTINATQSLEINVLDSKIGNGTFKAGVWENGVWNNGWRLDEEVKEFSDVVSYFQSESSVRWSFKIKGRSESVSSFNIGDNVSIGNIVAIDINENRKLLRDYYTILEVDENGIDDRTGFITVELDTTFPVRRIERDSKNHRIKVTKNVWLNGAFLNGYFQGVWNYGLFKGYPLITEMFNTNWIDGVFDGGHFKSEYYINGTFSETFYFQDKLGLEFDTIHKLEVGDIIDIQKDDESVNSSYIGETSIINVLDDYRVVTNVDFGTNQEDETGTFTTNLSTGVIQNFIFKSNNISTITSLNSMDSEAVFTYESWIDTTYLTNSAVNIGKPQSIINEYSGRAISENNLYGIPTDDVLSSISEFRDSYSLNKRRYNLGTKFKVYSDYIGDSSKFEEYFDPNSQQFLDLGWDFSKESLSSIVFSRTIDSGESPIIGEELKIDVSSGGGILDINKPNITIENRNLGEIEGNRYSVIEFDLIDYDVPRISASRSLTPIDLNYLKVESIRDENIIDIGDKQSSSKLYQPITQKWARYLSEFIYLKNEIQSNNFPSFYQGNRLGGEIKSISFYKSPENANNIDFENVKIYFGLTTSNSFNNNSVIENWNLDSSTSYINEQSYQLVYDSNVNNQSSVNDWVEINLDTPFNYDRSENLMILIYQEVDNQLNDSTKFTTTDLSQQVSRFYPNPLSDSTPWNEFFSLDNSSLTPGSGYIDGETTGVSGGEGSGLQLKLTAKPNGSVLSLSPIDLNGIVDSKTEYVLSDPNKVSNVNSIYMNNTGGASGSNLTIDYLLNNNGIIDSIGINNPGLLYAVGDELEISINDEFLIDNDGSCIGTFSNIDGVSPAQSNKFYNLKGNESAVFNANDPADSILSIPLPVNNVTENDNNIFELNQCNPSDFGGLSYYKPNKFGVDDIEIVFDYNIDLTNITSSNLEHIGSSGSDRNKIWIMVSILSRVNSTNDSDSISGYQENNNPITPNSGSKSEFIRGEFYPIDLPQSISANDSVNINGTASVLIEDFEYLNGKDYFFVISISRFLMSDTSISPEQPLNVIAEFGGTNTYIKSIAKPQKLHVNKVTNGEVTSVNVVNQGSGYSQGDLLTIDSGDGNSTIKVFEAASGNLNTRLSTVRPDIRFKVDVLQGINQYLTPILHFDNINLTNRELEDDDGNLIMSKVPATYFPISTNINHLLTPKKRKVEYFFNKKNLSMNFRGSGLNGINPTEFIIDNLNFYEVDMIPFFRYFNSENINVGLKLPLSAKSPQIDFEDNDLDFIENISIGLDSFNYD